RRRGSGAAPGGPPEGSAAQPRRRARASGSPEPRAPGVGPRRSERYEAPRAVKNVNQLSVTLLFLLTVAGCAPGTSNTPQAGASMSQAIIEPYLKIQTALASDSIDEVKANAGNIATAATALGAPAVRIDMAAVQ